MSLVDLLQNPISFHRPLVSVTGSICAGLMLSQALYWTRITKDKDGWFYKSQEEWKEETGMSRAEQETARKSLVKAGVWEERHDRLAHRLWFRVKKEELSRLLETCIPECGKLTLGNVGNPQSVYRTETTTETTTGEFSLQIEEKEKITMQEFEKEWNSLPHPFPKIRTTTKERTEALAARKKDEFFVKHWREALAIIPQRKFLTGENDRRWVASADFFLKADTVAKIMEGKYANAPAKPELSMREQCKSCL